MSEARLEQAIDRAYEDRKAEGLWAMARTFYGPRMRSIAFLTLPFGLVFLAIAVVAAIFFFRAGLIRHQILWAAVFVSALQMLGLMKIFAWQMIHRDRLLRAIQRLEARVMEKAGETPVAKEEGERESS